MERFFVIKGESCVDESLVCKVNNGEFLLDNGNRILSHYEFGNTLVCYVGEYEDGNYEGTLMKLGYDMTNSKEV